jgi:hypothetical protein
VAEQLKILVVLAVPGIMETRRITCGPHLEEDSKMLGRSVTVKYDQLLRPSHVYIAPPFHADFHAAMREMGILVEPVQDGHHRDCFKVIDQSQAATVEAAVTHWQEMGYWRHRPR